MPVLLPGDIAVFSWSVSVAGKALYEGATVELKLEIDAEVPDGIDKAKSRTLLENANTLGFIDEALD